MVRVLTTTVLLDLLLLQLFLFWYCRMSAGTCVDCAVPLFGFRGRGAHLAIPSLIAPLLAFLLVINRIYWRLRMLGRLGFDDAFIIAAMVCL